MSREVTSGLPQDKPTGSAPPPPPSWRRWLLPIGLLVSLVLLFAFPMRPSSGKTLTYSEFLTALHHHDIKTITIHSDGEASGQLADGRPYSTTIPIGLAGSQLLNELENNGVQISARPPGPSLASQVLAGVLSFLPFLLLLGLFAYSGRRAGAGFLAGLPGIGRARAKIFTTERPQTRFSDVAGYDGVKAEIAEVVDFLRSPERYRRAGAAIPRGVLMVGPPGTGKTLMARAVAGEAGVPFLSVTGSSFVEMFVGVGASRVRDLFEEARKHAPCIVFVDEIDAIGQRRAGAGTIVANDEREQTLNQLLAEMDGFEPAQGVVVLAATNRPEVLDPALLRPGRFDRQVTVPLPSQADRAAILRVHCRNKRLAADVDLDAVARATPGFSGAELANLVNEAAIAAARAGRRDLTAEDFRYARDRIILGRREDSNVLLPSERHAVAVHEAGHAVVAACSENADPVERVTILPAGRALGVTFQLPLAERHLYSESYLRDSLAVRLGGRAAELEILGEASTGAVNDLSSATELALRMVREYGLSPRLGPVSYPVGGSMYLPGGQELTPRPYAEATQQRIDQEVADLLRDAEERARDIIRRNRQAVDELASLLLEQETVDGAVVYQLVGRPVPTPEEHREAAARHVRRPGIAAATGASMAGGSEPRTAASSDDLL
ncbi:MAG: ATP-dependent zinc metalloprotease FtsH [Acidothermus cellulolyticus]|nr:ATP-dependent zinc metalloprotease FtsH [Acidothermus cellulolyticus]